MLAASMLGITSRLASPLRVPSGISLWRASASSAMSPCISPSHSSQGACSRSSASVRRIFCALGVSWVPKLLCDSNAAFGVMPKRSISSAAIAVISASCSGLGSALTCVSTTNTCRPGSSRQFMQA